jgi:hypothetical protein
MLGCCSSVWYRERRWHGPPSVCLRCFCLKRSATTSPPPTRPAHRPTTAHHGQRPRQGKHRGRPVCRCIVQGAGTVPQKSAATGQEDAQQEHWAWRTGGTGGTRLEGKQWKPAQGGHSSDATVFCRADPAQSAFPTVKSILSSNDEDEKKRKEARRKSLGMADNTQTPGSVLTTL